MKKFQDFCLVRPFVTITLICLVFVTVSFAVSPLLPVLPRISLLAVMFFGVIRLLGGQFCVELRSRGRANLMHFFANRPLVKKCFFFVCFPFFCVDWFGHNHRTILKWSMGSLAVVLAVMSIRLFYLAHSRSIPAHVKMEAGHEQPK